jgi:uncharacterized protein (DUF1015 family)
MAELWPFKGYRYSIENPEDLSSLISPPYDMLDKPTIDLLYRKSGLNAVRIDQNRAESTDTANIDRHVRAAALFADWTAKGLIRQETTPSFYVYEQQFEAEQFGVRKRIERTGIISLVKLVDFGVGSGPVLPHEYTLFGPKVDRYEHLSTTRLNASQIFGLIDDETGDIFRLIRSMKNNTPVETGIDADGVRHVLYICSDPVIISRFQAAARDRTILIADGHHRYETALKFYRDQSCDPAYGGVMMTLVSTADPGLVIRSFHRLIRKNIIDRTINFKRELFRYFTMTDLGAANRSIIDSFLQGAPSGTMLYIDSGSKTGFACSLNAYGETFLQASMRDRSTDWRHLDMSIINAVAVGGILGLPLDGNVLHDTVKYMNDTGAAFGRSLDDSAFYGGFFIKPVTFETIHRIVAGGERMPQKSTNFFPKLYSGLVYNRLGTP